MKIRLVGAEMFHADGRADPTDVTKLIVAFRNFANASKTRTFPVLTSPHHHRQRRCSCTVVQHAERD